MNCAKCRKLISEKFSGGISKESSGELDMHLAECSECRKIHDENLAFSKAIRGLDSGSVRSASIDAFSRLAMATRSYRDPKPMFHGVFQLSRIRTATVAAAILLVLVGLSNLNYSYSYTNGASMEISFNPPLEKSASINTDDFCNKINSTIGNALGGSDDGKRISWACTMKDNSLEKVAISVQTSEPMEITSVYNTLVENYPAFAKGTISVSPLREPVKVPFYKYVISRKRDMISDDQIRKTVNTDLLNYVGGIKERALSFDKRTEEVRKIIEMELPAIREIISEAYARMKSAGGSKILTTAEIKGGAQVDEITNAGFDPEKYIQEEIGKLVKNKTKFDNRNLSSILNVDFNGSKSRITIGDTADGLFAPYSVGGWGVTIIRDSGSGIVLDGIGEVVKPEELENLLNGVLSPDVLTSMVQERIKARSAESQVKNETTIIEVWNGEKDAEITIDPGNPDGTKIEILQNDDNMAVFEPGDSGNEKPGTLSTNQPAERELILRNPDISVNNGFSQLPPPSFSNEKNLLPDFILDDEIQQLVDGRIAPDELEKIIDNRIQVKGLNPPDQNIYLVRGGVAVTVKVVHGRVLIQTSKYIGSNTNGESVVIKFNNDHKSKDADPGSKEK